MRRAKIGDKIRIVSPLFNDEPYDVGDILTVKDVRGDGAVYVEENDSTILPSEFIVVDTKPTDVKVGDKIRIVRPWGSCGYYGYGDEFTVRSLSPLCPGGVFVDNIPIVINETEYEVIERAEEKGKEETAVDYMSHTFNPCTEVEIKVGDKVKVVNADCSAGYYDNGDILTVARIDEDGDIYVKEHPMIIYRWEVEPYKEVEDTTEKRKAKVGDLIKIVNPVFTGGYYKEGDTFIVKARDDNGVYVDGFGIVILDPEYEVIEKEPEQAGDTEQKSLADEVAGKVREILETSRRADEERERRIERVAELLREVEYLVSEIRSLLDIDEEEEVS